MTPNHALISGKLHVLIFLNFGAPVPVATIRLDASVLEVESFVAGHARVQLRLELDVGNLLVNSTFTIFVSIPGPNLEEV